MDWTTARARWFPVLAAVLVLGSCSGNDEPSELPPGVTEGSPTVAAATTGPAPTVTASAPPAECPNETAIAADPARQLGPSASADVDGDGIQDTVRLARDPAGLAGCLAFVVAELGNVTVVAAPTWEVGAEGGLSQPRINGFVDIDGGGGDEILIDEAAGASTQFVGAFAFVDGDLERVTAKGGIVPESGPFAQLFPYGGSVGHVEGVDCTDEGVVVSSAVPAVGGAGGAVRYEVERRFFTYEGTTLDEAEVETETVASGDLNRFPEFSAGPFGSC